MKRISLYLTLLLVPALSACHRTKPHERTDTPTSGSITVLCDDGLSPLMKEETNVFTSLHPQAKINLKLVNEVDALNLLFKDSVRLIVATRDLTPGEKQAIRDKSLLPRSTKIAVDGIALIVHRTNTDTLISVTEFAKVLNGSVKTWGQLRPGSRRGPIQIVFDNPSSSTVRYIQENVTNGPIASKNVYALDGNQAVLDYVAKTPNAIGIIGVNWVTNPDDTTQLSFTKRVRVMSVCPFDDVREDNSYPPYPAYLLLKKYPFCRDVYMIITDAPSYLPSGFMNFVGGDQGQRIVLKSGLVPATRPMRLVQVHE
jgi:phosphate transport system substrate-binding protein